MKVNMNPTPDEEPVVKKTGKPKKSKFGKSAPVVTETDNEEKPNKKPIKARDLVRTNKFWIALCVIFFITFLSVNSNMGNTKTRLTVKLRNLTSDTENMQGVIDEVKVKLDEQAKIDALTLTDEEQETAYNNATEQGERVMTLQNTYKTINSSDDSEKFNANVNALDECFDDASKNARVKWYDYDEYIPGTWKFASKSSFVGNTTKVLWLCYSDEDGILLAYCIAIYNADTKLFSDVEWKATKYAEAAANPNGATSNIVSVIDSLKLLIKEGAIKSTDADMPDQKTIDTNNEISEARKSLKEAAKNDGNYDSRYEIGIGESSDNNKGGNTDETNK